MALVRVEQAPTVSNVELLAAHFVPFVLDLVLALPVFQEDPTTNVLATTKYNGSTLVVLVGVQVACEVHIDTG